MTDRPSDRAIAQAFYEIGAGNSEQAINWQRIERRAREIDAAAPEGAQAVAWQVRRADVPERGWEACTRELYEATLHTGRYAGYDNGPPCEVRALYTAPPQPQAPQAVRGTVAAVGSDESGQPRILIHTSREALRDGPMLACREVFVSTTSPQPQDADVQQLSVLYDIRKAIGDNGKLMQDELVAVIAKLVEDAERLDWMDSHAFTAYRNRDPESGDVPHTVLVNEDATETRKGIVRPSIRECIDAARAAGGGG